jgi:DNA-binding NarL/FixJ family response regulator
MARIILADHQVLFRQALAQALLAEHWFVVAETPTGEGLEALIESTGCTILIIDRALPGIALTDFCSSITARYTELQVVLLVSYEAEAQAWQLPAFRAGIACCVSKDHDASFYRAALTMLAHGYGAFNQRTMRAALTGSQLLVSPVQHAASPTPLPAPLDVLTRREAEVLALVAQGRANPEIAVALNITTHTAMKHVSNIIEKLDINNRTEAGILYLKTVTQE